MAFLLSPTSARVFQFHYGSVKSIKDYPDEVYEVDFNSTMVRLKANFEGYEGKPICISIPLWFG